MGLIRSSARPTADGPHNSGFSAIVGAPTNWEAVDDPFGPRTVRGTSGAGSFDDLADDTDYIRFFSSSTFVEFVFGSNDLYFNGEDVALALNLRVRTESTDDPSPTMTLYRDHSDIVPDLLALGTITVPGDTNWHNVQLVVTTNPLTGQPWAMADLAITPPTTFGVQSTGLVSIINLSRFYISTMTFVGPTVGRDYRQSNWRFCDVCGLPTPYERTLRPAAPHPQAGLVICSRCYDQPDHDTNKIQSKNLPRDIQDALY